MRIEDLLIEENATVLEAFKRLDKVAKKVLFIVKDNKLSASVSDGDLRRWILKKGNLKSCIKEAANYDPKYLPECDRDTAKEFMKKHSIEALPILDNCGKIKTIVMWDDRDILEQSEKIDLPVVMMAGGKGTRLYPYTKILPKPLIPIGDIPIAERIINQFYSFGCNDFYLIVNHKKNMIKSYFNDIAKEYNVYYKDEDIPLGTGGGLSLLKGNLNTPFILTNCDILIKEDIGKIYKHHKDNQNIITMVCSLKKFKIPYGVVEINKDGNIETMTEKPELTFFTNTGCYIVNPEVIEAIDENTDISFPDIALKYKSQGKNVGIYPISENSWLDMGQIEEMKKMEKILSED